ncbi:MAG: hypothetical protein EBU36_03635 [Verrucomicrobia bacterium]|nr:hypothetical protein [Verrucomicrobiota bacterium]
MTKVQRERKDLKVRMVLKVIQETQVQQENILRVHVEPKAPKVIQESQVPLDILDLLDQLDGRDF